MSDGIRCMWMRGGTSKGGYFLADDLPADPQQRDAVLLRIMGSPDPRQIDGMGGADSLTSKVAIVRRSDRQGVDVDCLFLQIYVERPVVAGGQNCGNILAGVGPFAIERGLVPAADGETKVIVHLDNSGQTSELTVQTPNGVVTYLGDAQIDGVPGTAAPIRMTFLESQGASCGALLPTGNEVDELDGIKVTMIDNGMPVVVLSAADMGCSGYESPGQLDADSALRSRLESIRLQAGQLMNLGDVTHKTVPKLCLVAPPLDGGSISTRCFIPHQCHAAIGVLAAVSVATACTLEKSPAHACAQLPAGTSKMVQIEHPTGKTATVIDFDEKGAVVRSSLLRTARKLFDGTVFS